MYKITMSKSGMIPGKKKEGYIATASKLRNVEAEIRCLIRLFPVSRKKSKEEAARVKCFKSALCHPRRCKAKKGCINIPYLSLVLNLSCF